MTCFFSHSDALMSHATAGTGRTAGLVPFCCPSGICLSSGLLHLVGGGLYFAGLLVFLPLCLHALLWHDFHGSEASSYESPINPPFIFL